MPASRKLRGATQAPPPAPVSAKKAPRKGGKVETRVLAEGRFVRLVDVGGWEWAERLGLTGIVVIVAVTPEGGVLLTEQFRRPVGAPVLELPAGLAGDVPGEESEPLVNAAKRELMEETGYEAGSWEFLTEGPPSAGVQSEIVSLFLATDIKRTGPGGGDEKEEIVLREMPVEGAREWLADMEKDGALVDPKVFAGLYFAEKAIAEGKHLPKRADDQPAVRRRLRRRGR